MIAASHRIRTLAVAGTVAAACFATPAGAQDARSYILSTATTGGTYYPVGVAIATLVKLKLQNQHKLDMSAISSAGSTENVRLLRSNEAQFAIILGIVAVLARDGIEDFQSEGKQTHFRSMNLLWSNVEHNLIRKSLVKTGDMRDMAQLYGKKYSMGARNSGLVTLNKYVFDRLGVDWNKFDVVYQGYGPSADSFINGQIDGTNASAGPPVASVTRMFAQAAKDVAILEYTDEQMAKADGGNGLFYRYTLKAGAYPGLEKDVKTAAMPNFLSVRADVPENDVYLVTKTIYENLGFLQNIHAATKDMTTENAMNGLPVALHAGAAKYYREKGMTIPDRLLEKK